jgi:hypothetical protein
MTETTEEPFELPEPAEHTGTCHTDGCANADHPITMLVIPGSSWICGVCGQPIEDVS